MLDALEKIVDQVEDILDVLQDSVSLVQEIAQNGGDLSQPPHNALVTLEGVAKALEELPWILSETGLEIVMAATSPAASPPAEEKPS